MKDDSRRRIAITITLLIIVGCIAYVYQEGIGARRVLTPEFIHSADSNSPYSTLEGTRITIQPYGAVFDIPVDWLTLKPAPDEHVKNLFLSWTDLNEVNRIDREPYGFDSEDADVINSVLPFKDCVAHVGDRGWGNGLWNDLQARIYVTDLTHVELRNRIETDGLNIAKKNFEKASLDLGRFKKWDKFTIKILDAPTHFILNKRLDFYVSQIREKTIVFVFLHSDPFQKEIEQLLDSFIWQ